jgi:hypothetical protein
VAAQLWNLDTFRRLRGQRFAVVAGGSLRLVEIVDRTRAATGGETFLLLFEPRGVRSDASMLALTHPSLGTFDLGVTDVGRQGRLQAVVDQRRARVQHKET